jgi:hypothetical protein
MWGVMEGLGGGLMWGVILQEFPSPSSAWW